ncbi:hypothetical protein DFA_03129 [Cavenderia fasciculata]|uniref:Uncharacterized protein n=1 Tax=Cavenderia fasciculata TaxID=261658 RepID=F4PGQ0_CACFS|nr:uncharacterized protein DFA_03129 [Cavenderia fasciculata]EGG24884.1 hypothetical protein DFA_03129 [Cavenderia fasciculata]|eukprot:XP_004362735.1 hypothetical protein DFA_03129 [Cavenderia fasciculata]
MEVPTTLEYLSKLKMFQLKAIIQDKMSAKEFAKLKMPKSKAMLINIIEKHGLVKSKKIIQKKKPAPVVINVDTSDSDSDSDEEKQNKSKNDDDDGTSSSEEDDDKPIQRKRVTILPKSATAKKRPLVKKQQQPQPQSDSSDEEEEEEKPKKKQVPTTTSKTTITKKQPTKKETTPPTSDEEEEEEKKEEEEEPKVTREMLENMTVITLKAKYYKGVPSTKIPPRKALMVEHICKQLGIDKDDQEDESESESESESQQSDTESESASASGSVSIGSDPESESESEQVQPKVVIFDESDELPTNISQLQIGDEEEEDDSETTEEELDIQQEVVVVENISQKEIVQTPQKMEHQQQVEESEESEKGEGELSDDESSTTKNIKRQKKHEKTPSKIMSVITKTATPLKPRGDEDVRKKLEHLVIADNHQQQQTTQAANYLLPIDPNQIHQGTLPRDLEDKILLMLLQDTNNRRGRGGRFVAYHSFMWSLALVSRQWFNTVSSTITHLDYTPAIPLPYVRRAIGGEAAENMRCQLVKRIESVDLRAFLPHNEVDTKTKFLSLVELGSDDEGDSSDEEDDYEDEEEEEDSDSDDEYYYEVQDDDEVNSELHKDIQDDSDNEEDEEEMAARIKKEKYIAENKSIKKLAINNLGADPKGDDTYVRCISATVFDSVFFANRTITTLSINVSYITPKFFDSFKTNVENYNKSLKSLELIGLVGKELLVKLFEMVETNPVNLVELNFSTDPQTNLSDLKYTMELAFTGNTNLKTLCMGGGNQEFYQPIIEGVSCSDSITSLYINKYFIEYLPTLEFMQEYLKTTKTLQYLNKHHIRDIPNFPKSKSSL